jgi:cyclopropane fatty-acyl-phospholipid synthase-like methyltransferase
MESNNQHIKQIVDDYYTQKLQQHGATPQGVDWNSQASQELRFQQLLKIITTTDTPFTILDYGCGFGSMYEFMQKNYTDFHFIGYDIASAMITKAQELYPQEQTKWTTELPTNQTVDYVVASGIFNVRLDNSEENWKKYILDTLQDMNRIATKGFAFNVLTSYSDAPFMKDYLHYANPHELFDYCKKNFSKTVALLHDYPLYEFTILVKKNIL